MLFDPIDEVDENMQPDVDLPSPTKEVEKRSRKSKQDVSALFIRLTLSLRSFRKTVEMKAVRKKARRITAVRRELTLLPVQSQRN